MCRIAAFTSDKISENTLSSIMNAFIKSAQNDAYLLKVTNGKYSSHDDGWGIAATGIVKNNLTTAHHKSIDPIFYESSTRVLSLFIRKLVNYQPIYMIMHARKSSASEPFGLEYAHPFMMLSSNGATWFAHNGGAKKKILAEKLGVFPWTRVDSELLGYYVMNNILSCAENNENLDKCVAETYIESKEYIVEGSALNTTLLLLWRNKPHLYITHWVKEPISETLKEYYEIVVYRISNTILAGSISMREHLSLDVIHDSWILEPGVYELSPGEIRKLTDL